ncbi:UNKNOWN [Stylonychia lemnae]|uniref:Uncharacterized protein n=1 Tax=Stylonychia lemnae TaxID=5949 RepID=A0A078B519_STYLE|nr:UNKNOWN [Stylonychia lemnae]|eukprot:CDW88633.1 UNKNOWN [Stylonychia lemnae]
MSSEEHHNNDSCLKISQEQTQCDPVQNDINRTPQLYSQLSENQNNESQIDGNQQRVVNEAQDKGGEDKGKRRNQVVILIISLCLGFSSFPALCINQFFKDDLKLDPAELSLFNSIINFVWILKPIFGFISDSYPIFGSRRKSYLILFSALQAVFWIILGLWVTNLWQAILVKTMINICTNFQNLVGEAIMVEASRKKDEKDEANNDNSSERSSSQSSVAKYDNKNAATNVSIYLSLTAFSSLISSYLGGKLLEYISTRDFFMITSVISGFALCSGIILYEQPCTQINGQENQALIKVTFLQLARENIKKIWKYLKIPFIYKPLIFIFLVVLAPGVDDPFYYFQTNVLNFSPGDLAILNLMSSLANLCGIWMYRFFFRNVQFKKMIFFTTISFAAVQISKMLLIEQYTHYIGLSPLVYNYIIQFLYTIINELHLMPIMVLAVKMSPKQVEASFYQFIMAVINLGYLISYQLGGLLTWALGITAHNFQNLWILIVIATAFPVVTLLFMLLIPSKFDVNEEIEIYFKQVRRDKRQKKYVETNRDSFIKVKSNLRDDIEVDELLIDEITKS